MNENSNTTLVIKISLFMYYIARLHPFEEYFTLFPSLIFSAACQHWILCTCACGCVPFFLFYTLIELSIYFTPELFLCTTQQSRFFFRLIAVCNHKKIKKLINTQQFLIEDEMYVLVECYYWISAVSLSPSFANHRRRRRKNRYLTHPIPWVRVRVCVYVCSTEQTARANEMEMKMKKALDFVFFRRVCK